MPILNWHNLRMCEYKHSKMTINFHYLNNLFALYNVQIFLDILFSVYLIWSFHKRFSSNNTPRNLIDGILSVL